MQVTRLACNNAIVKRDNRVSGFTTNFSPLPLAAEQQDKEQKKDFQRAKKFLMRKV